MRKRPILLAVAVTVAGLAALGTVMAQQPSGGVPLPPSTGSGYTQPRVAPAGGPLPSPPVRPYGDWTSTPAPAGYSPVPPANPTGGNYLPPPAGSNTQPVYYPTPGTPTRPRLTQPGVATDYVTPAGGVVIPPPSMDIPGAMSKPPVSTPPNSKPLPPPSISVDPVENKFPPAPPIIPPTVTPVPQPPSGVTPLPLPPSGSLPTPAGTHGEIVLPPPLPSTPVFPAPPTAPTTPRPFPNAPAAPADGNVVLPAKVSQSVTVEAVCPEAVVYGGELRYELVIRNTGNVAAENVRVEDEIPTGARYIGSDPPAELNGTRLVWAIGTLDARVDKRIVVRVRPHEEGELRSRASVSFSSLVEAKTKVTRPRVAVTVVAPEVSRVGEDAVFRIKVSNSGTGPAQQMVLHAMLSDGLYHPHGMKLETKLANLAAGDSKMIDLPLSATKSGLRWCQITVTAEGSQDATAKAQVNIVEPMLQVAQTGPAKCLVRGEPTYEITLSNPGSASTDSITLQTVLPDGFDYVQASDAGAFNVTHRVVTWKLPALAAGGTKAVAVKLRAAAAGDVVLRTVAVSTPERGIAPAGGAPKTAGRVLEAKGETTIKAEGVAAVRFEVKDLEDPVEVGKEAVYEIRVTNQGTGNCSNVQLRAALSEGTTFAGANGPTTVKAQGQTLVFEPITNLAVRGEMVYTVRVRGNTAGDQRFRVQLSCDQIRTPVVKEESTTFYKQ